jgi:predicted metal-dependent hydrolase
VFDRPRSEDALLERRQARELIARLNRDGARIARAFGLRYRAIEAERANVKRRYGVCYSDGTIRIRLRHAVTGRALKYSSLVSTLCHELAHLRHFNHGPRFRAFYALLLEHARREGIYRPRRTPRPALAPAAAPRASSAPPPARAVPAAASRPHAGRSSTPAPRSPEQLALF